MLNNTTLHIGYIGRLEKEKWIEIIKEAILQTRDQNYDIVWHICWDGSYYPDLLTLSSERVHIHGHLSKGSLLETLEDIDIILMPSLFLETFWLVALEVLSLGKPVVWFRQGGLEDFIHPSLALDPLSPVDSFFDIIQQGDFPLVDVSTFSYDAWRENLAKMVKDEEKILLVNDYIVPIGWAEIYLLELKKSLESLGKTVQIYGYSSPVSPLKRIVLMILAPFSFWRKKNIQSVISDYQPDLIWMHSILRYIWPFWVAGIVESGVKCYMTHHDLGLISSRPSMIYRESDIPLNISLGNWVPKKINVFSILSILYKWLYIRWIWRILSERDMLHFVPSSWMIQYFQKYTKNPIKTHFHTIFPPSDH